jgi:predicted DNA repair protein MutK
MRTLSIVGTAAMFLVGGGILVHGFPMVGDLAHVVEAWAQGLPAAAGLASVIAVTLYNGLFGFLAGGVLVAIFMGGKRLLPKRA